MVIGLVGDGEVETAQGILNAAGVTVPTGDLVNGVYDEAGNFYQMPEQVVGDPDNVAVEDDGAIQAEMAKSREGEVVEEELERRREEKGKGVLKSGDLIKVRARLSDRGGPDVVIVVSKEQSVRVLIRKIQDEIGISGKGKVRIAYLGKILKEGDSLLAQGWREGHVINALVFE
ncbi:hypothetical protein MMC26_004134 [Xylographa opegraphella]|nr:hypothetical protein [Xylographa opegraphella]